MGGWHCPARPFLPRGSGAWPSARRDQCICRDARFTRSPRRYTLSGGVQHTGCCLSPPGRCVPLRCLRPWKRSVPRPQRRGSLPKPDRRPRPPLTHDVGLGGRRTQRPWRRHDGRRTRTPARPRCAPGGAVGAESAPSGPRPRGPQLSGERAVWDVGVAGVRWFGGAGSTASPGPSYEARFPGRW